MDMDDDMKKKALAWIECRKTIRTCDCCGNNSWTFGEDIVTSGLTFIPQTGSLVITYLILTFKNLNDLFPCRGILETNAL